MRLLTLGRYFGVIATLTGVVVPAPLNGDPVKLLPLPVNALTAFDPLFATQTFPDPSIAMLDGVLRPLRLYTLPVEPAGVSSVIVLLPEFATHAFPPMSIAIADGKLKPPAVKSR